MKAIYKTILKSTGRVVYVGQTKKVNGVGVKYFGSGIHKLFNMAYIRDHFISEIITTTEDQNEANYLERYYIDYYCTLEEFGGFNVSHGGLGTTICRRGVNNSFYGKHHTEESKTKNRESNLNNKATAKSVLQYTKNGVFVTEYKSMRDAERHTGIYHGSISYCCNGKCASAGGYIWKFSNHQ